MTFKATKAHVLNRGVPPDSFLEQIVEWAKSAPEDIFLPNANADVYSAIRPVLGPWSSIEHRRAAMLEVMRVHGGFESSWNWNEGVDTTNQTSMSHLSGQETGLWQVSFDSTSLGNFAMRPFAEAHGIDIPAKFITEMKADHPLAIEYYARLLRVNVKWAGPILRHEIDRWLSRDAVAEFQSLLA